MRHFFGWFICKWKGTHKAVWKHDDCDRCGKKLLGR
jgi:hypothetical protein